MNKPSGAATTATLRSLLEAFNAYDLDAIMAFVADDCELLMPRGPAPDGRRLSGKAAVREGLASRLRGLPDVHYGDDRHWVAGNLGVSTWLLTGTTKTGEGSRDGLVLGAEAVLADGDQLRLLAAQQGLPKQTTVFLPHPPEPCEPVDEVHHLVARGRQLIVPSHTLELSRAQVDRRGFGCDPGLEIEDRDVAGVIPGDEMPVRLGHGDRAEEGVAVLGDVLDQGPRRWPVPPLRLDSLLPSASLPKWLAAPLYLPDPAPLLEPVQPVTRSAGARSPRVPFQLLLTATIVDSGRRWLKVVVQPSHLLQ